MTRWLFVWRAKEGGRNAGGLIPLSDVDIGEQQTLPRNRQQQQQQQQQEEEEEEEEEEEQEQQR